MAVWCADPVLADPGVALSWAERWRAPGSNTDIGFRILPGDGNSVYAVGWSYGEHSRRDIVVLKISSGGSLIWLYRYDYGLGLDDEPGDAAIDPFGNVIVTGGSDTPFGHDMVTIKISPTGSELWRQTFAASNHDEIGVAVKTDSTGRIYVLGSVGGGAGGSDLILVRYESNSTQSWTRYVDEGSGFDTPVGLALDSSESPVTLSEATPDGDRDLMTTAFDTAGNERWRRLYDAVGVDEHGGGIAADGAGSVYVVGQSRSAFDEDGVMIAYDSDGTPSWTRRWNTTGADDAYVSIERVGDDFYVGGWSQVSANLYSSLVHRIDADGDAVWERNPSNYDSLGSLPYRLVVDAAGNAYFVGLSRTEHLDGDGNILTALDGGLDAAFPADLDARLLPPDCCNIVVDRRTSTNSRVWLYAYDGPGGDAGFPDIPNRLAPTGDGGVVVAGYGWTSDTGYDFGTVRYTTDGDEMWEHRLDEGDEERAWSAAVDDAGVVYVAGQAENPPPPDGLGDLDVMLVAISPAGDELWRDRFDGGVAGGGDDVARVVAVNPDGAIVVGGDSEGEGTGFDLFAGQWTSDGAVLWTWRYDGPVSQTDRVRAMAVDENGATVVAGYSTGAGTNRDAVIAKIDADGNEEWVARYNGSGGIWDEFAAVAFDAEGNVHATGYTFTRTGFLDILTVKYDSDGNLLWVQVFDGDSHQRDQGTAVDVGSDGLVYVVGTVYRLGTNDDIVTLAYDADGDLLWSAYIATPIGNYKDVGVAVAAADGGGVYVGGTTVFSNNDFVFVRYDESGVEQWLLRFDAGNSVSDIMTDMAVGSGGEIWAAGSTYVEGNDRDYMTVKYVICDGCAINGVCYTAGTTEPGQRCRVCNPVLTATDWSNNDGASCGDGNWCNGDEFCVDGGCGVQTGNPCSSDGIFCNGSEACNEATDSCFSPGNPCSNDSLFCNGVEYCDEDADACLHHSAPCVDDGLFCNGAEICDESDDVCRSTQTPCQDDGLYCTGVESCDENADTCLTTGDPCSSNDIFCDGLEYCEEDTQSCLSTGDPCLEDGRFCNGVESCDEILSACVTTGNPCSEDGVFCNGVEFCDEIGNECVSPGDPCGDDGLFCNGDESCDESGASCVSSGNPCPDELVCTDKTDECVPPGPDDDADDDSDDDLDDDSDDDLDDDSDDDADDDLDDDADDDLNDDADDDVDDDIDLDDDAQDPAENNAENGSGGCCG